MKETPSEGAAMDATDASPSQGPGLLDDRHVMFPGRKQKPQASLAMHSEQVLQTPFKSCRFFEVIRSISCGKGDKNI